MAGAVQQMMREVMDIRQAADYLGISGDTLYRYASEGTPGVQAGQSLALQAQPAGRLDGEDERPEGRPATSP